jgi:hypothetical protein
MSFRLRLLFAFTSIRTTASQHCTYIRFTHNPSVSNSLVWERSEAAINQRRGVANAFPHNIILVFDHISAWLVTLDTGYFIYVIPCAGYRCGCWRHCDQCPHVHDEPEHQVYRRTCVHLRCVTYYMSTIRLSSYWTSLLQRALPDKLPRLLLRRQDTPLTFG